MSPQPLKESTITDISETYQRAKGPFEIVTDNEPRFIVMRPSDLDESSGPELDDEQLRVLDKGYAEALRGDTKDAFVSLVEIRTAYGLWHRGNRQNPGKRWHLADDYRNHRYTLI